jgi:radical SAM enzyme (TIGR01210 family)
MLGFIPDDRWILSQRGAKNAVDPREPYLIFTEQERAASGEVVDVVSVFLSNSECPFKCLMCDLWRNTIDGRTQPGDIPRQIEWALKHAPKGQHIKLYNSGNFFDQRAVPKEDYAAIADLVSDHERVIVECHPKLIGPEVLRFRDMLGGVLEVAMGLETVHPEVLSILNKRMSLEDFETAALFLNQHDISIRVFALLRPPLLSEDEGLEWCNHTLDYAFDADITCCVIIPTRTGNGVLDRLQEEGYFAQPNINSIEKALEYGISIGKGRVFADLWDIERFSKCDRCLDARKKRIHNMNLLQRVLPEVHCSCTLKMENG